jgi:hypothetical protein
MTEMNDPSKSTNGHASDEASTGGSTGAQGSGAADETFGWTAEDEAANGGTDPRAAAERMLNQLQSMIDSVATQAAPVVRQIGAKAAELAAVAADRAGPLAHKAADATADASERLAERSRSLAADLRNRAGRVSDDINQASDSETEFLNEAVRESAGGSEDPLGDSLTEDKSR